MIPLRFSRACLLLAAALTGVVTSPLYAQSPDTAGQRLYSNHIKPLFAASCQACHNPESAQGGLDLTSKEALVKGGGRGPVVIEGDARQSLLYKVVAHETDPKMPFQADKLSPEALGLIATWIDLGAPYTEAPKATHNAAALFEDVRPILETKCLVCHGGKFKQAGLDISTRENLIKGSDEHKDIVIAGDTANSRLMKKVRHENDPGMPYQSDKLPPDAIAKLEAWISAEAPYTAALTLPAELGEKAFSHGRDHWAYQKPVKAPVPEVRDREWVRNPIDAFIAAERDKRDLQPVEEVSSRTLVRRVYLDLIGLPPTPEQVTQFLSDPDPQAYEQLVDRLLDSPRYGERWGRHWMDIWRYSDWYGRRSAGDLRNSQPFIWHWRDWIIESLTADKPYDRMIQEMLAADEIAPTDTNALRATGYLARNWFRFNRNVWVRDTVEYTAAGFLGVTIKCARCHDHKFDPIAQEEYYKLRAFFEPHDVRTDRVPGEPDLQKDGLARTYDAEPREDLAEAPFFPGIFEKTYRFIGGSETNPDTEHPLAPDVPEILASASNPIAITQVDLPLESYYPDLRPAVHDDLISEAGREIDRAEAALTKARQDLAAAEQASGGSAQTDDATVSDAKVDFKADVQPILETHCTSCHSGASLKSGLSLQSADAIAAGGVISGPAIIPGKSAESPLIRFLTGEAEPRMPYRQASLSKSKIMVIAQWIDQLPPEDPRITLRRAKDRVAVGERKVEWARANLPAVQARIAAEKAKYAQPAAPNADELAQAAVDAERHAHLLNGRMEILDAQRRLDEALGGPQADDDDGRKARDKQVAASSKRLKQAQEALGKAATEYTPLGKTYPKHSTGRRTALARWITGRDNPLTARVAVNHIWMRHFGEPFVSTVANFGLNGKPPTHPELLDWLAVDFMESGWSMNHLHRLMLMSSTYRMRSAAADDAVSNIAEDATNTWYWRMNARRMEAEAVRDSILHVAGELDTTMGGPELDEAMGEVSGRRSLYFTHTPNSQMLLLTLFDGGNASECYERYESIVPQQALALSNSKLSLRMARALTAKLVNETGRNNDQKFIDAAFERILARPPSDEERRMSIGFLGKQENMFQNSSSLTRFRAAEKSELPPADDPAIHARENLVHVLMNRNEFVVIR
ncbi:MAG: DUF1553 domain-containing protein [Acidobacteria bacterium]|nr:DUF1553 domain-containing protein [Acidobacteriota bacterium]